MKKAIHADGFFIGCGAGFSRDHVGTWIVTLVVSLAHGRRGFLRNEKRRRLACLLPLNTKKPPGDRTAFAFP
ncbi:MAG: hypothetical protein DRP64_13015 [Verrucomicrobia bacterium]|nr:MAG: hypothetical protein DRP64_13015 [Verrucomicrobiota bacterium]